MYEINKEAEKFIFEILKENKNSISDRKIYKLTETQTLHVRYLQLFNDEKHLKMLNEKYDSNDKLVKEAFKLISDKEYIRDRVENNPHLFCKAIKYCDNDYIIYSVTQNLHYCYDVIGHETI